MIKFGLTLAIAIMFSLSAFAISNISPKEALIQFYPDQTATKVSFEKISISELKLCEPTTINTYCPISNRYVTMGSEKYLISEVLVPYGDIPKATWFHMILSNVVTGASIDLLFGNASYDPTKLMSALNCSFAHRGYLGTVTAWY